MSPLLWCVIIDHLYLEAEVVGWGHTTVAHAVDIVLSAQICPQLSTFTGNHTWVLDWACVPKFYTLAFESSFIIFYGCLQIQILHVFSPQTLCPDGF